MSLKKIYSYFSVNLLFLCIFSTSLTAQDANTEEEQPEPFFRGIMVGTDLFSPIAYAVGTDYLSFQLSTQANLGNKFFPVWEIGVGKGNTTSDAGLNLKTFNSLYNRIGLNYNVLNKKETDFVYVGARMGFSSFSYDLNNIKLGEGYWDEEYQGSINNLNASVIWGEFLAGIQVKIISNLYMGWNIAYKVKVNENVDDENLKPWYIPGYGASKWGVTYHVYYKLPFW